MRHKSRLYCYLWLNEALRHNPSSPLFLRDQWLQYKPCSFFTSDTYCYRFLKRSLPWANVKSGYDASQLITWWGADALAAHHLKCLEQDVKCRLKFNTNVSKSHWQHLYATQQLAAASVQFTWHRNGLPSLGQETGCGSQIVGIAKLVVQTWVTV